MRQLDILLIKPGSQQTLYGELSSFNLTAIEPPLWGALLASYLRECGFSVELIDAEVENWDYDTTAQKISEINPILAAVVVSGTNPSASTMNMTGAGLILKKLKDIQPTIKTVLTGLHPSALPHRTLDEESVDYVCQGEGFFTLPDLIKAIRSKRSVSQITGLWHRENGKIVGNSPSVLISSLDQLPMPAWDLLPMEKYRAHNWHCFENIDKRQPYAVLYTSLGCPFKCSFCCINALFGRNTIRYRALDQVINEIDVLVSKYGIRNIKIIDEMFALNEKRVVSFCEMIIERGYSLNMWAYARVNTVTNKMLAKMKKAGINWIAYGFESGSKRVIDDVSKGYRLESIDEVVKMTYDKGLYICANYILGLPEDNYDSMNETLQMMLNINAEWANIYHAMAFPGSKLYEQAIENELPLPETWQGYSQYAYESLPLPTKYLSSGQVLAYRDYAFNTYYRSPRYLNMIEKRFGKNTVGHIKKMAQKELPRKNIQI